VEHKVGNPFLSPSARGYSRGQRQVDLTAAARGERISYKGKGSASPYIDNAKREKGDAGVERVRSRRRRGVPARSRVAGSGVAGSGEAGSGVAGSFK